MQQARNLAADLEVRMESSRFLLRDRDSKCGKAFDTVLQAEDLRVIKSAPQAPRMTPTTNASSALSDARP